MVMSSMERFKLRRQMAAAAGKKSTTSLSVFRRKSFPPWPLSVGQKEFGLENGSTNKKKRGGGKFKRFRRGTR